MFRRIWARSHPWISLPGGGPGPRPRERVKTLDEPPPFLYGSGNEGDKGILLPSRETRPLDDTKTQPFKRISASAMPRLVHPRLQASRRRLHPGRRPRTAAGIALPSFKNIALPFVKNIWEELASCTEP